MNEVCKCILKYKECQREMEIYKSLLNGLFYHVMEICCSFVSVQAAGNNNKVFFTFIS